MHGLLAKQSAQYIDERLQHLIRIRRETACVGDACQYRSLPALLIYRCRAVARRNSFSHRQCQ
jgi:hypothetical protein